MKIERQGELAPLLRLDLAAGETVGTCAAGFVAMAGAIGERTPLGAQPRWWHERLAQWILPERRFTAFENATLWLATPAPGAVLSLAAPPEGLYLRRRALLFHDAETALVPASNPLLASDFVVLPPGAQAWIWSFGPIATRAPGGKCLVRDERLLALDTSLALREETPGPARTAGLRSIRGQGRPWLALRQQSDWCRRFRDKA